jgi:acyl carrier protein
MDHNEDVVALVLHRYIRERFGIPTDDPTFGDSVDLFALGYIDSFGAVELSSFIAEEFGISVEPADWIQFPLSNIREISAFVRQRRTGQV